MAIDTTAKRASATFLLLPFYAGVITDGTIDIDETMAVSWMYNGIGIVQVIPPISISETGIGFTLYIDRARDFTSYIDQARNFDLEL
jgi:hypothetical protein